MHPARPTPVDFSPPPFDNLSFTKYVKDIGKEYRQQGRTLVSICRTFTQAQMQTRRSHEEFRSVLQVVDDALYSVTEAWKKTTKDADAKLKKATDALSTYEKKYHRTEKVTRMMADAVVKDRSSSTFLKKLKETFRPLKEERTKIVDFFLHKSLPDRNPTIVQQVLSPSSDIKEILWNFSRFKDGRRLALKDHPHFYKKLPILAEKYEGQFRTDPVETLQENEISVLTDNPGMAGRFFFETAKKKRTFGNAWAPKEAIIFKDVCGRLEGESIIGSAIENTPNLWCFEEPPLSNSSWPSSPDQSSSSPTPIVTPTTSPTGALLWDWRIPVLRMLRSQDVKFNIRISDTPPSPTSFSSGYSGPSLPNPVPNFSSIVDNSSPALQFRPTLEIQIPGAHQTHQPLSSYMTAQSIPLSQLPLAVELPSGSPASLSPESPILPTPPSNVAPPTGPTVELFPSAPASLSPEPPILPTLTNNATETSLKEKSRVVPNPPETGTATIFSQTHVELPAAGAPVRRPAVDIRFGVTTDAIDSDLAGGLITPPQRSSVVVIPPKPKPNRTWIQKCVHVIKKTVNTLRP